mgnify:CR=1 FL=1
MPVREFYSAVVERNADWSGKVETEPYEAGWASEAIALVRVLGVGGMPGTLSLRAQVSPDGIQWCDEGTESRASTGPGLSFIRLCHLGNWLRLAGETTEGATFRIIAYWALKQ